MEPESLQPQHEQTIVPVKPGVRGSAERAAAVPLGRRFGYSGIAAALLAIAAFVVFFVLPRWVEDENAGQRAEVVQPVEEPAPAEPELSEEELAALEARGEQLLAQVLTQQRRLEAQYVAAWGGEEWARYTELSRSGDDAFLAKDFQRAVNVYSEALQVGESLLARSVQIVARALETARQAFAAGNAALAIEQFDIVLGIDADHAAAKSGRARAEKLPGVLALVSKGHSLRDDGDLTGAAAAYREALAIDADWEPARSALTAVNSRIEDARFERLISAGFNALSEEDFEDAEQQFRAALAMRPGARAALDGLTQAEQGLKLDQIALAEARALAFERRELWDQAVAQYEAALETDATLAFANAGLQRARARADLEAKLLHLIGNPNLLFDDGVLADARKLLEQARSVEEPGPRLTEQIGSLDRLIVLAATPITVELRSDEMTEVTLYRVGALGTFAAKQVELRPGTYTAVGSRNGYRDVRLTFTVLPGRDLAPIDVVCVEPITGL